MVVYEALSLSSEGQFKAAEEALVRSFDDPDCCVADWPAVVEHIVKATGPASAETLAWATLDAIQVTEPVVLCVVVSGDCSQTSPVFLSKTAAPPSTSTNRSAAGKV